MGFLGYLSLVALLSCGIQGASLPYQNGYQFHLNHGVLGLPQPCCLTVLWYPRCFPSLPEWVSVPPQPWGSWVTSALLPYCPVVSKVLPFLTRMGISSTSTMGFLGYLSLVALLSCGIQGASLPYQNGYQFHLNQKGVHMDLEMKDLNPLVGGKAHVELPISPLWKMLEVDVQLMKPIIKTLEKTTLPLWKLLEVEAPFLKPIIIALEKNTLGKIYDVMTVKADMTFNAEEILKGIFNVAVDYTLVHKDGAEEKATLLIQGKNESGQLVTSMEIIPKNNVV